MRTLFKYLAVTCLVLGVAWASVGVRIQGRTLYGHAHDVGGPALKDLGKWWDGFDPKKGMIGIGENEKPSKKSEAAPHAPKPVAKPAAETEKHDANVEHLKKMAALSQTTANPAPSPETSGGLDKLIQAKLDASR